ncbi:hypothetical protein PG994_005964 [Apiospora phragmitis]|uniref:Major facilitator superfamily (MFS) profile domain-containing protein n=1 Tax=Apiospora phragmitis TaxID=2905665 RepID=A0ABR1VHI2_9PEZI
MPQDMERLSVDDAQEGPSDFITGWKLAILLCGISVAIFLPNLEISIVSTALVTIANDLHGFRETGWVVVAYLITYTGFIIVWAKLSDIFKRKWALLAALTIFIIASALCGASQNMTMLIVFRAVQGLGGAGCFSISMVVFFELIPQEKYPKYGSIISADIAFATLLGPIIGGAIADSTTWRWSVTTSGSSLPIGLFAVAALAVFLPNDFPFHGSRICPFSDKFSIRRVDFLGTFLLVGANLFLVTALLEASTDYSWSSALVIVFLVISGLLWILFVLWSWVATRDGRWQLEPVFPFRFFTNRYWMGMLMQSFFLGFPFTMLVISLPQRFQTVNSLSALDAGVRLLPYAMFAPLGSLASNILIGLALLASEPVGAQIPARLYGYEIVAGFGVGITFGTLVTITPASVESRDLATATGAMIQFRQMGGAIGLSIGSTLLNSHLKSSLAPPVLTSSQLNALLQDFQAILRFPLVLQEITRNVFSEAFSLQLKVVVGLAAALFPAILMMIKFPSRTPAIPRQSSSGHE